MFNGFAYNAAKKVAASAIIANPLIAIVAIIIALVAILIIGSFTVAGVISILQNPWVWVLIIVSNFILKPNTFWANMGLAAVIGFLFWSYAVYLESVQMQTVCGIPLVGNFICWIWDSATALPKLYGLCIYILTMFMLTIGFSAIRTKATGGK